MSHRGAADEIITKFLLNTCRLNPQMSERAVLAVMYSADVQTQHPVHDVEANFIPLATGSAAEFHIEPMLSCVGDIDLMYHWNCVLAIPAGQSPPTQLPAEFHNYVQVHDIVESHLPGYVYLVLRWLLTQCSDDGKYNAVEYDGRQYLSNRGPVHSRPNHAEIHGPAMMHGGKLAIYGVLAIDVVLCARCLSWPPQAADWPARQRNCDWPDSETIDRVISNGCDVVGVAHRQRRDDERMGSLQWRLSFSRAEVALLNSWMPVQQIVYHLLRYFMKTEHFTDNLDTCESYSVSNYHIKTLMLWACELKPRCWWTEDISFVKMCVDLLHIFADWLTAEVFPHYFINNCNLIESSFNPKVIAKRLSSIDDTLLTTWLVDNYIRKCSLLCPDNVSRLFNNVSTSMELQNAVSAVIDWKLNSATVAEELFSSFVNTQISIASLASVRSPEVVSYNYLLTQLSEIDTRLCFYFLGVAFLRISMSISEMKVFEDELMDVLATLFHPYILVNTKSHCDQRFGDACLNKATKLMKHVASRSMSTDQLIKMELSKAYLYRALRCTDSYSDSIYSLANVYLAVLYYATGEYQTAIDHCIVVLRSHNHAQRPCVVQGELLPKLDDHIDSALGLSTLYQYVLTKSLNQPERKMYVTVFTPELFAQYLQSICCQHIWRTSTQTSLVGDVQYAEQCVSFKHELLIADVLLFMLNCLSKQNGYRKAVGPRCQHPVPTPTELNTSKLVELLQKSAVEHLTTYRQLLSQEFVSVATVVTTDFEALYECKRGNYQRCLQLTTQNVDALLDDAFMSFVLAYPAFVQLMDDDIVSLIALISIVNPGCRMVWYNVCISQLTLALYLTTQCQLRVRQSVTSLSRTLRYILVARTKCSLDRTLDNLTLKLAQRKALSMLAKFPGCTDRPYLAVAQFPSVN